MTIHKSPPILWAWLVCFGCAAVLLLFLGEPFSQKDLDEANGKTLGDDANATDDGAKAA